MIPGSLIRLRVDFLINGISAFWEGSRRAYVDVGYNWVKASLCGRWVQLGVGLLKLPVGCFAYL